MKWLDSARARLHLLFARRAAESRMNNEFRFQIEMETDELIRVKGLAPDEARRQALAAFGGMEKHKEAMRDGRGLAWLSGLSLDLKLGGRMLLKHPVLTLAGGLALAIAILDGSQHGPCRSCGCCVQQVTDTRRDAADWIPMRAPSWPKYRWLRWIRERRPASNQSARSRLILATRAPASTRRHYGVYRG